MQLKYSYIRAVRVPPFNWFPFQPLFGILCRFYTVFLFLFFLVSCLSHPLYMINSSNQWFVSTHFFFFFLKFDMIYRYLKELGTLKFFWLRWNSDKFAWQSQSLVTEVHSTSFQEILMEMVLTVMGLSFVKQSFVCQIEMEWIWWNLLLLKCT